MKRLLILLAASCLAVWACAGDDGGGLFNGSGTRASGGSGNAPPTGTGANAAASGAAGPGAGGTSGAATGAVPGSTMGGTPGVTTGGVPGVTTGGVPGVTTGGVPGTTTGGVPGTTTGGVPAGTTGGSGPGPGYYSNSPFAGYAWTASSGTNSTITPANYDTKTPAGAPFCASGSVGAMSDYSGTGMIGININQAAGATDFGTWTPTGTGIVINVTNSGGSELRVQIQGPAGGTDASQRWCAPITQFGQDVTIPWSAFNTACWDNSGTYYSDSMAPLAAVLVLVPGGNAAAVSFNFCINKLGVAGGSAGGTGGTGPTGSCQSAGTLQGTGTLNGSTWSYVRRDGAQYVVQSNVWGSGSAQQTVTFNGNTFQVTQQTGNNSTSAGPVSYPSAFIGSNNSRNTGTAGLPKQVSAIGSIPTCVAHNGTGSISGVYNSAYDIWFSTGSGGDSGNPSGGFVMLWLYKPGAAQPNGSIQSSGATVGGMLVDVWVGTSGGRPCISYVARSGVGTYNGDLKPFIQDATTRGISSSWYLTNVFFGFEIWSGGVGLSLSNCSIAVN